MGADEWSFLIIDQRHRFTKRPKGDYKPSLLACRVAARTTMADQLHHIDDKGSGLDVASSLAASNLEEGNNGRRALSKKGVVLDPQPSNDPRDPLVSNSLLQQ